MSTESVWYLLPELLLIAVGTLIYIGGAVPLLHPTAEALSARGGS